MLEKMIVLFILYTVILISDVPRLKQKMRRERWSYTAILMISFYICFDFLLEKDLPGLNDLVNFIFSEPAKMIVESVKLPEG